MLEQESNSLPLNGLVLAGGRSSRMGSDKGMLRYHNKPQREHVYDMLSLCCQSVFISCNKEQATFESELPILEDQYVDAGPLGGILSAFDSYPNAAWFVVGCDMPLLKEATLKHLLQNRNTARIATAFWNAEENFPEPLVAIWEPAAFAILQEAFDKGLKSPGRILLQNGAELVTAANSLEFTNVNTPVQYEAVLAELKGSHSPQNSWLI